jgi:hypothetical protein
MDSPEITNLHMMNNINISTSGVQQKELGGIQPYWKFPSGDIVESIIYYGESKRWNDTKVHIPYSGNWFIVSIED